MSFHREFISYVSEMKRFQKSDWKYYICWVGLMLGLLGSTSGFIFVGVMNGVQFPAYVWNIPIGIFIFVGAIALDTIGHQTRYKTRLDEGEGFVHQITISLGIASVVFLCLGYSHPEFFRIPIIVLITMSIFYSVVDEVLHWRRYIARESDPVEMWSHVFIFLGHITMSLAWYHWFASGYPGVRETLLFFDL